VESLLLYEFQLFAPVTVRGERRYAILDTGAAADFAYGAVPGVADEAGETQIQGAVGTARLRKGRLEACRFLGAEFAGLPLLVSDVPEFGAHPFPVSFRFGAATLLSRPLVFDFQALKLGYATAETALPKTAVAVSFVRGLPMVTVEVGGEPLRAIFDTAAGWSVANTARAEAWRSRPVETGHTDASDPTGASQIVPVCQSRDVSVGGVGLGAVNHLMFDLSGIEAHLGVRIDLLLGVNTMVATAARWVIDREREILFIER
jgi:hypothetical protein